MKKILAILLTAVLAAAPVFAAAAKPVAESGIRTLTQEAAEAHYPGVLIPGSVSDVSVFVSNLPSLGNSVMFEYIYDFYTYLDSNNDPFTRDNISGSVTLNTDLGVIGVSVQPTLLYPLIYIGSTNLSNIVGLSYANTFGGIPVGAFNTAVIIQVMIILTITAHGRTTGLTIPSISAQDLGLR